MIQTIHYGRPRFGPDMTILGIISRCRQTEAVFRRYDAKAGVCLVRESLFDPLKDVAEKYRLDLEELLTDLHATAGRGKGCRKLKLKVNGPFSEIGPDDLS